ncbi:MAG: YceD family protein [Synechococcales bacterium]|nr:YceD family protein [Synechococcales bacterium]
MDAVYIPRLLKLSNQTETVDFQEYLPGLETLTPVQGSLRVTHHGNYLEVVGRAEAIVTLACDRCLQNYNHRLQMDASELIWLEEPDELPEGEPLEKELSVDELVETLPPRGYFSPSTWIYEQLCLQLPQRQLCDPTCPGIDLADTETKSLKPVDRRWASLEALRGNLLN